jgi:hypothetical protein
MHVCCTFIVTYLHVFARIARICTYLLYGKLLGVSIYVYLHILSYTCKYVHKYVQIRANTFTNTYKNLRIQYGFNDRICTYMHVYAHIFEHDMLIWTHTNLDRICTYMYVCVCIWRICMYIARICMYFQLWPPETRELMPIPQNTFPMDGSQRAPLRAPQGIWAVGMHFFPS